MSAPATCAAGTPAMKRGICSRTLRRIVDTLAPAESDLAADARTDLIYLVILLAVLLLPIAIKFDPGAAGPPRLLGMPLPGTCFSHEYLHVDCPGCGMTRALILVAHGRFAESLHYHRLGILLYIVFAGMAAYRAYRVIWRPRTASRTAVALHRFMPLVLMPLLIANWLFNVFTRHSAGG